MKLDFLIPASPTPAFYSQIAMFRRSLDRLGGDYRDARLVAVFGDRVATPLPVAWRPHFERIDIAWADPADFERLDYRAQCSHRYAVMRPDADLVFMCDADTIMMRGFGREVLDLAGSSAIGGGIAHSHFPWERRTRDTAADWNAISIAATGVGIPTDHRYSLPKSGEPGACPFYVNFGFVAGAPTALTAMNRAFEAVRPKVLAELKNIFDAQVTFALVVHHRELPVVSLPMRYNFPNEPHADERYPLEREAICLLHYQRRALYDRHRIFAGWSDFDAFLGMELEGSSRDFQALVRELTGGDFPFVDEPALDQTGDS